jgi:hypothetical protein
MRAVEIVKDLFLSKGASSQALYLFEFESSVDEEAGL